MPVDPITIRLATADDLAVLHSREAHPDAHLALRHLERQEAGDYFFALAEQGGDPLGFCVLDADPENDLCPEIKSLWVYPESRRLGAGRALTSYEAAGADGVLEIVERLEAVYRKSLLTR